MQKSSRLVTSERVTIKYVNEEELEKLVTAQEKIESYEKSISELKKKLSEHVELLKGEIKNGAIVRNESKFAYAIETTKSRFTPKYKELFESTIGKVRFDKIIEKEKKSFVSTSIEKFVFFRKGV